MNFIYRAIIYMFKLHEGKGHNWEEIVQEKLLWGIIMIKRLRNTALEYSQFYTDRWKARN